MRISGKERDYYDSFANYDKTIEQVNWYRNFSFMFSCEDYNESSLEYKVSLEIEKTMKELINERAYLMVNSNFFHEKANKNNHFQNYISIAFGYIFFCGNIIPYLKVDGELKKTETFYTVSSAVRAFKRNNEEDLLSSKIKKPSLHDKRIKFNDSTFEEQINLFFKQIDKLNINSHSLHLINKEPVYIINPINDSYIRHYQKINNIEPENGDILIGGRLSDYQFSKHIDNFTCLQELELYLGNNLVSTDPIDNFSNEVKILSHGFDLKTSFRKGKENKKN